jgi:hypothetical protein
MRIKEWCAVLEPKRVEHERVATKEGLAAALFPVLAGIVKLAEAVQNGVFDDLFIPMRLAEQFERDLADTVIRIFAFCLDGKVDLQAGIDRVLDDPTWCVGPPDFDVTEEDMVEILMNHVAYPAFVVWGEVLKNEDPEGIRRFAGYMVLSLFRLADQMDFRLAAAIDSQLAQDRAPDDDCNRRRSPDAWPSTGMRCGRGARAS